MFDRQVQEMLYRRAKTPADLPWHRDAPDRFLVEALQGRERGRALDLGCGSGVFSVYMAQRGLDVTALDVMPRALEMARERGRLANARVEWVQADLLEWQAPSQFDVILDSGCLHSLIGGDLGRYRSQLLRWLAPGGDYVLGHFGRRGFFDWRPIPPARRTRADLVSFFAPELREHAYESQLLTGIPLPIGPTVLGQGFWFKRA